MSGKRLDPFLVPWQISGHDAMQPHPFLDALEFLWIFVVGQFVDSRKRMTSKWYLMNLRKL